MTIDAQIKQDARIIPSARSHACARKPPPQLRRSVRTARAARGEPDRRNLGVRSEREASDLWNEWEAGHRRRSVGTRWRGQHRTDAMRRGSPANADRRRADSTCTPYSAAAFSVRREDRDARKAPPPGRRRRSPPRRGPAATSGDFSIYEALLLMIRSSAQPNNLRLSYGVQVFWPATEHP